MSIRNALSTVGLPPPRPLPYPPGRPAIPHAEIDAIHSNALSFRRTKGICVLSFLKPTCHKEAGQVILAAQDGDAEAGLPLVHHSVQGC
jgi:hypothetical protein